MKEEVQSDFENNNIKNSKIDSELNLSLISNNTTDGDQQNGSIRRNLHGDVYQIHVISLVALRCKQNGSEFTLAAEINKTGKFDDVVLNIDSRDKTQYLIQVKHIQDESKKIKPADLWSKNSKNGFLLSKYFVSYLKIRKDPYFNWSDKRFQHFCIFTNIDIDEKLKNDFVEIDNSNMVICTEIKSKKTKYLKLDINKIKSSVVIDKIIGILMNQSELQRLADKILPKDSSTNQKPITYDLNQQEES